MRPYRMQARRTAYTCRFCRAAGTALRRPVTDPSPSRQFFTIHAARAPLRSVNFHPQGGGQLSDRGTIAVVDVVKVKEKKGQVSVHYDLEGA
jgi:alanyl-tRNA synthetase